jgi:hypothetical protein
MPRLDVRLKYKYRFEKETGKIERFVDVTTTYDERTENGRVRLIQTSGICRKT